MASLAFAALCGFVVETAQAGWRHGSFGSSGSSGSSGSFGSSGSSGSWGSSGSSGSYGSSGSSGSSSSRAWRRELRAERRAHRRAFSGSSSHGSSGLSGYRSHGSSGSSGHYSSGSYGSHGSSGYSSSSGSSGSYGGVSYHTTQAAPQTRAQSFARSSRQAPAATPSRLRLEVPADASVYLVGQKMNQTGARRSYRLPELPAGQSYEYPVVVQIEREGRTITARFTEQVTAGTTKEVTVAEQSGQLVVRREGAGDLLTVSR